LCTGILNAARPPLSRARQSLGPRLGGVQWFNMKVVPSYSGQTIQNKPKKPKDNLHQKIRLIFLFSNTARPSNPFVELNLRMMRWNSIALIKSISRRAS
jgi:hypothetical protein